MTFSAFSRLTWLAVGPLLLACGGERMSVGSNEEASSPVAPKHCSGSDPSGDLQANTQEQIDALRGCEIIDGSLTIWGSGSDDPLSLASLASLRVVTGSFELQEIPSLAGLEALEQVGNLALGPIPVYDLLPLSNLERVIWEPPGGGDGGVISIGPCPNLQSLAGLEKLTSWTWFGISDAPELATLAGLAGPPKLLELYLAGLPALRDLHGLEFVREADAVNIVNTGVSSLRGLSLSRAESLLVQGNRALTDLNALSHLYAADHLQISDNDSLLGAELSALSQVQSIKITGNPQLTKLYAYSASEGTGVTIRDDPESASSRTVLLSRLLFEVGNNARLEQIAAPDGFKDVQQISIWGNPVLTKLDLSHLEHADGLEILDNPALQTLTVPELERVGDLEIVDNPRLSTAALDGVQTFSRTMSGNGTPPAPATPTPPAAP
jgi:hypothetical protein